MSVREYLDNLTRVEQIAIFFFVVSLLVYAVNPVNISLVLGNSMKPTFDHGDVVIYSEHIDMEEGNIVVYEAEDGQMVTHRLIAQRSNGKFVAKGDNNNYIDETLVTESNYKGTLIWHVNTSKYIPTDFLWDYYPGKRVQ